MRTIRAVFENGGFRPIDPVELPEGAEVTFEPLLARVAHTRVHDRIGMVLSETYLGSEMAAEALAVAAK